MMMMVMLYLRLVLHARSLDKNPGPVNEVAEAFTIPHNPREPRPPRPRDLQGHPSETLGASGVSVLFGRGVQGRILGIPRL